MTTVSAFTSPEQEQKFDQEVAIILNQAWDKFNPSSRAGTFYDIFTANSTWKKLEEAANEVLENTPEYGSFSLVDEPMVSALDATAEILTNLVLGGLSPLVETPGDIDWSAPEVRGHFKDDILSRLRDLVGASISDRLGGGMLYVRNMPDVEFNAWFNAVENVIYTVLHEQLVYAVYQSEYESTS